MKRLIKKSQINLNMLKSFLTNISMLNYKDEMSKVPQIINEYPECVYNGPAYRVIRLNLNKDASDEEIKKAITVNNEYCSWSKTENGVMNYCPSIPGGLNVIIKANVSALDLVMLSEIVFYKGKKHTKKYDEDYEEDNDDMGEDIRGLFKNFQEVLAPMTNNYEIYKTF